MTTIDDVSTNNTNIKHLDTTKNIVITPKDEFGNSVQLNAAHTWTAKVSDGNNYIGDYPVTIESNSIVVNSSEFTKLPAGSYHLEVWEEWIDSNSNKQRSIYPSPQRTIDFNIYQNITDLSEKEIKTIGFQDVVDQAVMNIGMNYVFKVNTIEPDQTANVVQAAADGKNYVTFNIPRGDKGDKGDTGPAPTLKIGTVTKLNSDQTPTANVSGNNGVYTLNLGIPQGATGNTGTVDNTGLTSAPAFQALQTQVNNSAVGTNLLLNTKTATGAMWITPGNNLSGEKLNGCNVETQTGDWKSARYLFGDLTKRNVINTTDDFVFSAMLRVDPTLKDNPAYIQFFGSATDKDGRVIGYIKDYADGKWHQVSLVFKFLTTPTNTDEYAESLRFELGSSNGATVYWTQRKLEKGSKATDWSLNPSEILTQADYAKIQAAIVALGGSLS